MDVRELELLANIDAGVLGQRIRAARIRAGMTQAELADVDATPAYLSRIEGGQRRPAPDLLDKLAERLGTESRELLEGVSRDQKNEWAVGLDHAELELLSGNADAALHGIQTLLDAGIDDAELASRAARLHALALESLGRLDEAIEEMERLADRSPGDAWWIKVMTALCRCYREAGDVNRAVEVGERALNWVDDLGLGGLEEAVALTLTLAAAFFERGDAHSALRVCHRALDEADRIGSVIGRAGAYWNASVIASRRGDTDSAMALARKALALMELGQDNRNLARLRTQLGILYLRLDPPAPDEALDALRTADRELASTGASVIDVASNHLAQARAELLQGDTAGALDRACDVQAQSQGVAPLIEAEALALLGQLAYGAGDSARARTCYDDAVRILAAIDADGASAHLWFELGSLLAEAGAAEEAGDAYRRAAVSAGVRPLWRSRSAVDSGHKR